MIEIRQTIVFSRWMLKLRDDRARAIISARIDRFAFGNPGDVQPVGGGISELRIDYGPGYRVYFINRNQRLILLLCGGDKSTQTKDIKRAKMIAAEFKD